MDCMLHDETNASYHADEAIGSTKVKAVALHSLAHPFLGENKISKYVADEGTGTHLSWQGEAHKIIYGGDSARTREFKDGEKEAALIDGVCLPEKPYKHAIAAGQSARRHPHVGKWMGEKDGWFETSVRVTHRETELKLKARPTRFDPYSGMLIELKTTVSAAPWDFEKQFFRLGYHYQAAFYRKVCNLAGMQVLDRFDFLAVEKTPPYCTQHFVVEKDLLDAADESVEAILRQIAQARNTGEYSTGWPPVSTINLSNTKEFLYGL